MKEKLEKAWKTWEEKKQDRKRLEEEFEKDTIEGGELNPDPKLNPKKRWMRF